MLPKRWQLPYGTIAVVNALSDIDARLQALEARRRPWRQRTLRWLIHLVNANPFVTPWQSRKVERLDRWLRAHDEQQAP